MKGQIGYSNGAFDDIPAEQQHIMYRDMYLAVLVNRRQSGDEHTGFLERALAALKRQLSALTAADCAAAEKEALGMLHGALGEQGSALTLH